MNVAGDVFINAGLEKRNNSVGPSTAFSKGKTLWQFRTVRPSSDDIALQADGSGGQQPGVVGPFLGPNSKGNLTALGKKEGTVIGVEGPVTLALHAPTFVHFFPLHAAHQFVKFARQAFLITKPWEVAGMVDQHAAVDGHRSANSRVFRDGSNHG